MAWAILNIIFIIGGIAVFVLFVIVLLKLNRALSIWLSKNEKD